VTVKLVTSALILAFGLITGQSAGDGKTLVFADFEKAEQDRPVTTRGGAIEVFGYQASEVHKSAFKGPELVRVKKDDPNHAIKFDFGLTAPQDWTGVTIALHGLPDADGKLVPDDVSGFKTLSIDVYATGVEILRLEAVSNERGKDTTMVYPRTTFRVRSGMNTYKVPLKNFNQPSWAEVKVDAKEILKRLTSINLSAFCDECQANKQGMVIVDNVVFEK
jgi:hypothetical protein